MNIQKDIGYKNNVKNYGNIWNRIDIKKLKNTQIESHNYIFNEVQFIFYLMKKDCYIKSSDIYKNCINYNIKSNNKGGTKC